MPVRFTPDAPEEGWKIAPAVQRDRDFLALDLKREERVEFPDDPKLAAEIARDEKRLGLSRAIRFTPDAPIASQADVRRTEPGETPGARQARAEKDFNEAMQRWRAETGGALKPGQDVRQATAEWSGMQDPQETAKASEIEHLRETGEVTPSDSVAYTAGKGLATTAGFVTGGPAGATGAGGLVDLAVLSSRLNEGVQAGAITQDEAADVMLKELVKRVGVDAAFNYGIPMLGQALSRVPGAAWLGDKVKALATKAAAATTKGVQGPLVPKGVTGTMDEQIDIAAREQAAQRAAVERAARAARPAGREAKLEKLAGQATTAEGREAVGELGARTEGILPSPGAVTGYATKGEAAARRMSPETFERARVPLAEATEAARQETTRTGQSRQQFGQSILDLADETQRAVKARNRPRFEAANALKIEADMATTVGVAEEALRRDAGTAGGKLLAGERAKLEKIVNDLTAPAVPAAPATTLLGAGGAPARVTPAAPAQVRQTGAEATLDFISARKADGRAMTAEGAPTKYFQTVLDDLVKSADQAYVSAAQATGQGKVVSDLMRARGDYRRMMSTVFDDALAQAARRNPEQLGKLIYGGGQVSNVQQLNKLLAMAVKEGKLSVGEFQKLRGDMARGFLDDAARDSNKLATWSDDLRADTPKREMWEALTRGKGGPELRHNMKVLEQMAQISKAGQPISAGRPPIPLEHAFGRAIGAITGTGQLGFVGWAEALSGYSKLSAALYTQGEKGLLNQLSIAMSPKAVGTAAQLAAITRLADWARKNSFTLDKPEGESNGQPE